MAKHKKGVVREKVWKKTQKEGGNAKKEMLINSLRSRSEFEMSLLLLLLHTLAIIWPLVLGLFFYIIKFMVFQYITNIDREFNHKNDLLEFKISNK